MNSKLSIWFKLLEESTVSIINGNIALKGGLILTKDSLALESSKDNPYVYIVVVKHGNEANPAVQAFVALITSDELKQFIDDKYDESVIPAYSSPAFYPK